MRRASSAASVVLPDPLLPTTETRFTRQVSASYGALGLACRGRLRGRGRSLGAPVGAEGAP